MGAAGSAAAGAGCGSEEPGSSETAFIALSNDCIANRYLISSATLVNGIAGPGAAVERRARCVRGAGGCEAAWAERRPTAGPGRCRSSAVPHLATAPGWPCPAPCLSFPGAEQSVAMHGDTGARDRGPGYFGAVLRCLRTMDTQEGCGDRPRSCHWDGGPQHHPLAPSTPGVSSEGRQLCSHASPGTAQPRSGREGEGHQPRCFRSHLPWAKPVSLSVLPGVS